MEISYIEYIGFIGAFFTTLATLPQLLAIYKTKNVEGISLNMFLMLSIGVLLWLLYGILKSDIVLIIANVITSILLFINIVLVVKYQKKLKIMNINEK